MQVVRLVVAALVALCTWSPAWATSISEDGYSYAGGEGAQLCVATWAGNPFDVRYGRLQYWVQYAHLAPGECMYCTATEFGMDPAPGSPKSCFWRQRQTGESGPPQPAPAPGDADETGSGFSWSSSSHAAQLGVVLALVAFALAGYRLGQQGVV